MKIFVCGQKAFGKEVLKALIAEGHEITGIAPAPQKQYKDKMVGVAMLKNIPIVSDCDKLTSSDVPDGTELVVSAHSHWMISDKILEMVHYVLSKVIKPDMTINKLSQLNAAHADDYINAPEFCRK